MKKYIGLLGMMTFLLMEGLIFSAAQAEDPPTLLWSKTYDSGIGDYAKGVATDADGNIIAVGGTANDNWLIRKYSTDGSLLWSQTYYSKYSAYWNGAAYGVTTDTSGNIIAVGNTIINDTNTDWHIRKYSVDGSLLWSQTYGGGYNDEAYGVATDTSGNIIVVGYRGGWGTADWVIRKYSVDGSLLWSQTYGGGSAYDVATDTTDNIIVAGYISNGTNVNWHVRKYGTDGSLLWSQTYDGGAGDYAYAVTTDASGNIIAVGRTDNGSGANWHIRKYSTGGSLLWSQTYNGGHEGVAKGVTADASGNIVVAGYINNSTNGDWHIRKYSADGNLLWSQIYDGGSGDEADGVAIDTSGNIIAIGNTHNGANSDWLIHKYGTASPSTVTPAIDNTTPKPGDTVCVQVNVADVSNLYAASFDLLYNPAVLDYTGITTCGLMGQNISLQAAPLNGNEGTGRIVVGISRLGDTNGVSGSGCLANLCFKVIGNYCSESDIIFSNASLECPAQGCEISATWNSGSLKVTIVPPVNPITSDPGTHNRLDLCWDAVSGATSYEVYRSNTAGGTYTLIGTTANTCYQDTGCILPTLNYYYQVRAIANGSNCISEYSVEASGLAAGLLSDINNDHRVDGRDLSRLGRAFGTGNDCRSDLNRSGMVDGDDLSKLAADFGKTL